MAPYAPLPSMAPPETAGGIVDLGEHGVLPGVGTPNIVPTGLTDFMHRSRWKTCQRKNTMKRI